jgi:chromosome segregation ATPase
MFNQKACVAWSLAVIFGFAGGHALAQAQKSGGIVCWKDKSGKTVGCGDKVPPEYQDNANKVLNDRGITVKQSDPALTAEQKAAMTAEADKKKADAQKREEEKRRDRALLDSFTNEKEIDLKRTRDIQQIEVNISAQQSNLKNVTDRQSETRAKMDVFKKENKPVPTPVQEDFDRLETEKSRIQGQILQKRKEIVERNQEYDTMKKRFMELKGGTATAAAPAPAAATAAAPAKK